MSTALLEPNQLHEPTRLEVEARDANRKMKSIATRVDELMMALPLRFVPQDESEVRTRIRRQLLAVARDQRHACAEAIYELSRNRAVEVNGEPRIATSEAHQAVMTAEITSPTGKA